MEWISVKDRLPEKTGRVITWDAIAISLDIYSVKAESFFAI